MAINSNNKKGMITIKELTLEITNQCMNNCLHCSSNCTYDKNNIQELSFKQIKEFIAKYNPKTVNISGGEPFEHPQILDILNYLEDNKIQHNLYTSLYPINTIYKGRLSEVLKIFKEHKYLNIIIPFHSYNNTINDLFMGRKDITNVIKTFITILGDFKSVNCSIHIVPTIVNIHTLNDTIQYLISQNVNNIKLLKLVVQGRCESYKDIELPNNILKEKLNELQLKYQDKIKLGLPFNEGECVAGKEKLVVMNNGKIIPCESYKSGKCMCNRLI